MQPKTLAASPFAPQASVRLSALALQIPMFLAAACLAAMLVARVEAGFYAATGAAQPDAQAILETMIVAP